MSALLLGTLAGLAVAMPVGPVGVLLLRSGLVDGVRVAVPAALGIATVDLAYGALAVAVGRPVSRVLEAHDEAVRAVSAAVLVGVGVLGLVRVRRPRNDEVRPTTTSHGSYLRFVALTAVNPLTAVTFTTVAVGMAAGLSGSAALFVVGVGLASLAWQLVLALASGLLGMRLPDEARTWVSVAGAIVIVLVGVSVLV